MLEGLSHEIEMIKLAVKYFVTRPNGAIVSWKFRCICVQNCDDTLISVVHVDIVTRNNPVPKTITVHLQISSSSVLNWDSICTKYVKFHRKKKFRTWTHLHSIFVRTIVRKTVLVLGWDNPSYLRTWEHVRWMFSSHLSSDRRGKLAKQFVI